MTTLDKSTNYYIDLGGSECETCGYNAECLSVSYEDSNGEIYMHYSVGCYGGSNLTTIDVFDAANWLRELKTYSSFTEDGTAQKALDELIFDLKELAS